MLIGMTAFAQMSLRLKDIQLNLEMRSVNHRFLDFSIHLPDGFAAVEDILKGQLKNRINRGRVTVSLAIAKMHPKVIVDYDLADKYVRNLKQLNQRLGLHDNLSLNQIVNLEGVLKIEKAHPNPEFIQALKSLIVKALDRFIHARQKEGRALTMDILRRIRIISAESIKIRRAMEGLGRKKRQGLSDDEYGVFLKNTDIAEELTRLSYHLKNFSGIIHKGGPCGKELDFIAQEIQREANTISAKAQSAKASSSVVKIKSAVEQVREQVQNVE